MGLSVTYWVHCDLCGEDAGGSKPTLDEAYEQAQASGWSVFRGHGITVCEECTEANTLLHPQYSEVFCVLCASGEHTRVVATR